MIIPSNFTIFVRWKKQQAMTYFERIKELTKSFPVEIADFSAPRDPASMPTQAESNFITNNEQGDWAENLLTRAVNDNSKNYIAIKYGKSDDLVAGDPGFSTFFNEFQTELDTIGKRPDILIFKKEDYREDLGMDISHIDHNLLTDYVKKAIAGIEVRSSAFLLDKYELAMQEKIQRCVEESMTIRDRILDNYTDLLSVPGRDSYLTMLQCVTAESLQVLNFRCPSWKSSPELIQLCEEFKNLKAAMKDIQKRTWLSITPKIEDLKVVYKWIENYNVPHYYFQVFFDKIYAISFENILKTVSDSQNEGSVFSVESDTKNQNKTTIKIRSTYGTQIAARVDEPSHESVRKEMDRGRLLFYIKFHGGTAYLDVDNFKQILNIEGEF